MLGHNRFEAMITPDSQESRQTSLSNTWRRFRPAPSRDQRYPVVDNVLVHVLSRLTMTENPIGRSGLTLGIKRLPVSSLTPCTSRTPHYHNTIRHSDVCTAAPLLDPGVILNGRARTGDRTRSRKPSNAQPSGTGCPMRATTGLSTSRSFVNADWRTPRK